MKKQCRIRILFCAILLTMVFCGLGYTATIVVPDDQATIQDAVDAASAGDIIEVKTGLFQNAFRMGREIRRNFRLRSPGEVMEMSRILYRFLGIDFEGKAGGDVTIKSCFFSHYYSPQVCRLISSLDEGLAAGLSDGGRLDFSQRITEDKDCCKARLVIPEKKT